MTKTWPTCVSCGNRLPLTARAHAKTCSAKCRQRRHRMHKDAADNTPVMPITRTDQTKPSSARRGSTVRTVDELTATSVCRVCGDDLSGSFFPEDAAAGLCTPGCRMEWLRQADPDIASAPALAYVAPPSSGICQHAPCGNSIVGSRRILFCSDRCQMRAFNARREADGRLARYRAERRQRQREQADPSEVFSSTDVYERDGWACRICDAPLNRDAAWPAPDSPSVDHIVPLSKGGAHALANVQAAHLRCNLVKGNRVEEAA